MGRGNRAFWRQRADGGLDGGPHVGADGSLDGLRLARASSCRRGDVRDVVVARLPALLELTYQRLISKLEIDHVCCGTKIHRIFCMFTIPFLILQEQMRVLT